MINQFIKDLPIYINGFAVTYIFMQTNLSFINIIMFILTIISFFWYKEQN